MIFIYVLCVLCVLCGESLLLTEDDLILMTSLH